MGRGGARDLRPGVITREVIFEKQTEPALGGSVHGASDRLMCTARVVVEAKRES